MIAYILSAGPPSGSKQTVQYVFVKENLMKTILKQGEYYLLELGFVRELQFISSVQYLWYIIYTQS